MNWFMRNVILSIFVIFFPTLFSACIEQKDAPLPILGPRQPTETDTAYPTIPPFSFVNHDSTVASHKTFDGSIYVAGFFFPSCRTNCPKMKRQMVRVDDASKDDPDVLLLSHTIDPMPDSVALLHDYPEPLGVSSDKWHFVTGKKEDIYRIAQESY